MMELVMHYAQFANVVLIPILGVLFKMNQKMTLINDTHSRIREKCCLYSMACPMHKEKQ